MNMMKRTLFAVGKLALATASVAMLFASAPAQAQAAGGTIHGLVTDPAGSPVTKGEVRFTTDKTAPQKDMKFTNVTPLDATGNYKATGVKAGDYIVFVFQGDVAADYQQVTIKDGDDK